jgi:hypothetical protein
MQQQEQQHDARVDALCALPFPPHPPLTAGETGSFAHDTVTRRLPLIVEGVIADLRSELAGPRKGSDQSVSEAAERGLAQLRDDMAAGAPLAPAHHPLRMPGEAAVPATPGAAVVAASSSSDNISDDDARFAVACRADAAALGLEGARGSPREALAYCLAWTNAGVDAAARVARPKGVVAAGGPPTWVDMPWLAVECYLYARMLAGALWSDDAAAAGLAGPAPAAQSSAAQAPSSSSSSPPQHPYYDPFARQKAAALAGSAPAAEEIGRATLELLARLEKGAAERQKQQGPSSASSASSAPPPPPAHDDAAARQALHALCQYALWGNKTDLSLSAGSAAALSKGGSAVLEAAAEAAAASGGASPLLCDDFDALWRALAPADASSSSSSAPRTVHLVLDNAALELFSDLCLADGLLASGCASVVVLHGKPLPWFVSDALAAGDLGALLWPGDGDGSNHDSSSASGRALAARWREYAASGRLLWAEHPFWTTPLPFWWMGAAAPELEAALFGGGGGGESAMPSGAAAASAVPLSSLPPSRAVIFKGDLNYRKLTADCRWPWTTPFAEALGPLGGKEKAAAAKAGRASVALVTLRTLKADVVAGLAPGVGEACAARDKDWQVNGRFGVVQAAEI